MSKIDIVKVKNEIKGYIARKGLSMRDLMLIMAEKYNRKTINISNFSSKLSRGTLKYTEVLEIAETLGYKIKWEEE